MLVQLSEERSAIPREKLGGSERVGVVEKARGVAGREPCYASCAYIHRTLLSILELQGIDRLGWQFAVLPQL